MTSFIWRMNLWICALQIFSGADAIKSKHPAIKARILSHLARMNVENIFMAYIQEYSMKNYQERVAKGTKEESVYSDTGDECR